MLGRNTSGGTTRSCATRQRRRSAIVAQTDDLTLRSTPIVVGATIKGETDCRPETLGEVP